MNDTELLALCAIHGLAKWEPFTNDLVKGEVVVNGLRYCCRLDEASGLPILHTPVQHALAQAVSRWQRSRRVK